MNALCYKIFFSKRLGALVAVGEHTVGQGKAASGSGVRSVVNDAISSFIGTLSAIFSAVALTFLTASVTASVGFAAAPAANALPSGASVNSGSVAISSTSSSNAAVMNITQTTDKASVNWQSFNIGSAARVNVQQNSASSVLLNRVVGNDPSQIFGKLSANGQIVLVNPNGIVFGSGGSVTASAFTASAFGINEQDFASGKYKYTRSGSTAGVTVQDGATLNATAPGGYIALIGASVDNQGRISTKQGAVVLAAGESITLPAGLTNNISVPLSGKVRLELLPSTINAMVANSGTITTEGGQVLMQAAALSDAVASVTQTGSIDTTGNQGGAVTLLADGGVIKATGSIKANSTAAGNKGADIIIGRDEVTGVLAKATDVSGAQFESKGGFVETSGEFLKVDGIQVKAKEWLLDPNDIVIGSTATTGGSLTNAQAANGVSQILASDVSNALTAGTNVIIATSASATGGNGDITVNAAVSNTAAGNTLTLNAGRNVVLNNSITASNISLNAATGSVSGAGALTTTGMLTLNSATAGTLSGNISGTGGLTKTGAGTTTLTGASTYTGATAVNVGTLVNTNMGNLKTSSISITAGATFEANVAINTYYDGTTSVKGAGTFQKTGAGGLSLSSGTASLKFEDNAGGKIDIQKGALQNNWLKGALSANFADVNIESGALLDIRGEAVQMRGLTGSGNVINTWANTNILTIGAGATASNSFSYNGIISAAVGNVSILPSPSPSSGPPLTNASPTLVINLVKAGAGTQVLTNNNIYTGTTIIKDGGTLQIGDGNGTGTLGTGNVTLANGSNLSYQRNVNTSIANAISGAGNVLANITGGDLAVTKVINLSGGGNIYLKTTNGKMTTSAAMTGTNITLDNTAGTINATTGAITQGAGFSMGTEGISLGGALTATANVNILGVNKTSGTGSATNGIGVNLTSSAPITAQNISIRGASDNSFGIQQLAGALNASGGITLNGTSKNWVGVVTGGAINAGGALSITGTKTTNSGYQGVNIGSALKGASVNITGESLNHWGVAIGPGRTVEATGGDVTINGTSGTSVGISLSDSSNTGSFITAKGNVNLVGNAGNASQSGATGVKIFGASTITAGNSSTTTPGSINITGTVNTLAARTGNGVDFQRYASAARLTSTGDISIIGTVTGDGNGSGIALNTSGQSGQAPMMNAGAKFTLRGNNRSLANSSAAIYGASGIQVTAGSDIVIQAETNNATQNAINFTSAHINPTLYDLYGNASFKSSNGNVLIQTNQGAINFSNALSTNYVTGTYTSSTDISGKNITIDNTGAGMAIGAGTAVTGSGGTQGASIANGGSISSTGVITKGSGKSNYASGGAITFNSSAGLAITATENVNIAAVNNGASQSGLYTSSASAISGKNVTIDGSSLNSNGVINYGTITATGGDVNIAGASVNGSALSLQGAITGSQNVAITASNTIASNGSAVANISRAVTATNGKIDITTSTPGTTANALQLASGANLSAKTEVNIKTDTLSIDIANASIKAGASIPTAPTGTVTIKTDSTTAKIDIGAGDVGLTTPRTLGLTNAELNRITAANLVIGDASNTGGITVSAATTTNATTGNFTLQTGGNITFNKALTIATGKTLTLNGAGASSTISQASINAGITADKVEFLGNNSTVTLEPTGTTSPSANKIGVIAGKVKSFALTNQGNLEVEVVNGTTGLTAAKDIKLTTTAATGTALNILEKIESTAGNVEINATTSDTTTPTSDAIAAVQSSALVKGEDITMNAVALGTTGKTLGYRGAGIDGKFEASNNLTLKASTQNTGSGFYMYRGALSAGNELSIEGTSALGQGVGFHNPGSLINVSSERGITIKGTASNSTSTVPQAAINLQEVNLTNNSSGAVTLEAIKGDITTSGTGTLIQNGNGDVKLTTVGDGNITVPKIINNGTGNVVIAAGSDLDAGNGGGGQVKTFKEPLSNTWNEITQNTATGKTYIYSGNATDTDLLSRLDGTLGNLQVDGTSTQNVDTNAAFGAGTGISGSTAKAQVIFREKVTITNGLVGTTVAKTYGDANTKNTVTAGLLTETIAKLKQEGGNLGTLSGTSANYTTPTPTSGNVIKIAKSVIIDSLTGNLDGAAYSGAQYLNANGTYKYNTAANPLTSTKYAIDSTTFTSDVKVTVAQKALTGSIASGSSIYGDPLSLVAAGATTLTGGALTSTDGKYVTGDTVTAGASTVVLNLTNKSTSGNLKAGTNHTQTLTGLDGADKDNYSYADVKGNYTVDKLALAGSIAQGNTTYGDTLTAGAASFSNLKGSGVTTDVVTATGVNVDTTGNTSTSVNLKAGTHTGIQSVTGITGTDADNYTFAAVKGDYTVDQKPLTSLYAANDKVFDGNTTATVTGILKDIITGDAVTPTHTSATFNTAVVGSGKIVTVVGIALAGVDASNYKLDPRANPGNSAQTTANITAVPPVPPGPVVPTNTSSARVKIPLSAANPFQLASAEELGGEDFCQNTSIDPLKGESSGNSTSSCTCEESKLAQDAQICFETNTQKISVQ